MEMNRHEEAIRQLEEALRIDPDHLGARQRLTLAEKRLGVKASESIDDIIIEPRQPFPQIIISPSPGQRK